MFNLIRRISHGVIPRPDRPWEDDPTSNAPNTRRKRRLSSTERDTNDDEQAGKKRARGDSATPSVADVDATFESPAPQEETKDVTEVTEGVKEVDLGGKDVKVDEANAAEEGAPESVPLPEEKLGELDELSADATVPAIASATSAEGEGAADDVNAEDTSDVASSSGEDATLSKEAAGHAAEPAPNEPTTDKSPPTDTTI